MQSLSSLMLEKNYFVYYIRHPFSTELPLLFQVLKSITNHKPQPQLLPRLPIILIFSFSQNVSFINPKHAIALCNHIERVFERPPFVYERLMKIMQYV